MIENEPRRSESPENEDPSILERVDLGLRNATELYRWWLRAEENNAFHRIPVVRLPDSASSNYTFLSEAPLSSGLLPVVGLVQEIPYDRPRPTSSPEQTQAEWYRAQVQEFMMRHFMHLSTTRDFRLAMTEGFSARKEKRRQHHDYQGWGYYQLFYKASKTGRIGKFPPTERFRIVDLREIGRKYEWIVLKIRFFNFVFRKTLAGADGPRLEVPVELDNHVVINSDFVINRTHPEPGVLGEYGFGTPVVPVPDPDSILAYGPSCLSQAFQFILLRVLSDGEVRAKSIFVANRPTRLIKIDPVEWGFQIADLMTFGAASRLLAPIKKILCSVPFPQLAPLFAFAGLADSATGGMISEHLCISKNRIYRDVMAMHFQALYRFILQTLPIWSCTSDWLDEKKLPPWSLEGSRPEEEPPHCSTPDSKEGTS